MLAWSLLHEAAGEPCSMGAGFSGSSFDEPSDAVSGGGLGSGHPAGSRVSSSPSAGAFGESSPGGRFKLPDTTPSCVGPDSGAVAPGGDVCEMSSIYCISILLEPLCETRAAARCRRTLTSILPAQAAQAAQAAQV
jgi:hypothetical protein